MAGEVRQLSNEDLVKKANVALQLMGLAGSDRPTGMSFRAAKQQRNGGILYELNSAVSATWLMSTDVKPVFLEKFDPGASAKGATFPHKVRFVPVAFKIEDFDERRKIEEDSGLPRYSLDDLRWMKPVNKREKNQRCANLLIYFPIAQKTGLYIRGARLKAVPQHPEPQKCNKCSRYEKHKAAECPSPVDICGICGKDHRTRLCTVTAAEDMYCVNCKQRGHGAISRDCPTFWVKKRAMDSRNPATLFKYVVVADDPSTWEPASPEPTPPPPTASPPYLSNWRGPPAAEAALKRGYAWELDATEQPPRDPRGRPRGGPSLVTDSAALGAGPRARSRSNSAMRQQTLDNTFSRSPSSQQQVAPTYTPPVAT